VPLCIGARLSISRTFILAPSLLPIAPVLTVEHVGYWAGAMGLVTPEGCELPIETV